MLLKDPAYMRVGARCPRVMAPPGGNGDTCACPFRKCSYLSRSASQWACSAAAVAVHCYFTDLVTGAAGTRLVLTTLTLTDIIPIPSRHNITT
jgi:hypothetical protein